MQPPSPAEAMQAASLTTAQWSELVSQFRPLCAPTATSRPSNVVGGSSSSPLNPPSSLTPAGALRAPLTALNGRTFLGISVTGPVATRLAALATVSATHTTHSHAQQRDADLATLVSALYPTMPPLERLRYCVTDLTPKQLLMLKGTLGAPPHVTIRQDEEETMARGAAAPSNLPASASPSQYNMLFDDGGDAALPPPGPSFETMAAASGGRLSAAALARHGHMIAGMHFPPALFAVVASRFGDGDVGLYRAGCFECLRVLFPAIPEGLMRCYERVAPSVTSLEYLGRLFLIDNPDVGLERLSAIAAAAAAPSVGAAPMVGGLSGVGATANRGRGGISGPAPGVASVVAQRGGSGQRGLGAPPSSSALGGASATVVVECDEALMRTAASMLPPAQCALRLTAYRDMCMRSGEYYMLADGLPLSYSTFLRIEASATTSGNASSGPTNSGGSGGGGSAFGRIGLRDTLGFLFPNAAAPVINLSMTQLIASAAAYAGGTKMAAAAAGKSSTATTSNNGATTTAAAVFKILEVRHTPTNAPPSASSPRGSSTTRDGGTASNSGGGGRGDTFARMNESLRQNPTSWVPLSSGHAVGKDAKDGGNGHLPPPISASDICTHVVAESASGHAPFDKTQNLATYAAASPNPRSPGSSPNDQQLLAAAMEVPIAASEMILLPPPAETRTEQDAASPPTVRPPHPPADLPAVAAAANPSSVGLNQNKSQQQQQQQQQLNTRRGSLRMSPRQAGVVTRLGNGLYVARQLSDGSPSGGGARASSTRGGFAPAPPTGGRRGLSEGRPPAGQVIAARRGTDVSINSSVAASDANNSTNHHINHQLQTPRAAVSEPAARALLFSEEERARGAGLSAATLRHVHERIRAGAIPAARVAAADDGGLVAAVGPTHQLATSPSRLSGRGRGRSAAALLPQPTLDEIVTQVLGETAAVEVMRGLAQRGGPTAV